MTAEPLTAGRGGFARARGQPHLRPAHRPGPVLTTAPELGNPLSVPEDASIGYGTPAADAGEPEPLRVTSVEICPLVFLQAQDEHGNTFDLTGTLDTFLPFARQALALNDALTPQPAPQYQEPEYDEPHSQAG
jgi:hypothetical protein